MTLDQRDIAAIARRVADELRGDRAPFFTPKTLAEHLAVSERTVWQMIRDGRLPSYRVGGSRRIDPADVLVYLSRNREGRAA